MDRDSGALGGDGAPAARSALFVPANRADMLTKSAGFGPDIVIVDLEDSVTDGEKDAARATLFQWLDGLSERVPSVAIRVNSLPRDMLDADLAICLHPRVTTLMLPKACPNEDTRRFRPLSPAE